VSSLGPAERRSGIVKVLNRRKYETIYNLAVEFGVSERTIRRDIETLSITEPIYTVQGRYDGGVYINNENHSDFRFFDESETTLVEKLIGQAREPLKLDPADVETLKKLLAIYSKPLVRRKV
jgi:DeoR/GlpR family transcriptional regulator of sugar metabolism